MQDSATGFWVGLAVMIIGAGFLYEALQIDVSDEAVGPILVPFTISILLLLLGALQALRGFLVQRPASAVAETSAAAGQPLRLAAVIAVGALYMLLFPIIGYFLSTLLALALMMMLFGNRPGARFAVVAISGAVLYQIVFIEVMGVHDPAALFKLRSLLG